MHILSHWQRNNELLVYTTQVNSTFRARWLVSSEVISQILFNSEQPKKNKMAFVGILSLIKVLFGSLVIQLLWYILIHLRVGDYSPPLQWIIFNYFHGLIWRLKLLIVVDLWRAYYRYWTGYYGLPVAGWNAGGDGRNYLNIKGWEQQIPYFIIKLLSGLYM